MLTSKHKILGFVSKNMPSSLGYCFWETVFQIFDLAVFSAEPLYQKIIQSPRRVYKAPEY